MHVLSYILKYRNTLEKKIHINVFSFSFLHQLLDENKEGLFILTENVSHKNIKNGRKPTLLRIYLHLPRLCIQYKNTRQLGQKLILAVSQHFYFPSWFPDKIVYEML